MCQQFFWLIRKDLLSEWRAKEFLLGGAVFGLIVFSLFHFSFPEEASRLASGAYWFALFFGGILGLLRLHERETAHAALDLLRLSQISTTLLFLSKIVSLMAILLALEALLIVPLVLMFDLKNLTLSSLLWGALIGFLAAWGFALIGSLLTAVAGKSSAKELILPLVLLPILSPLFIAASEAGMLLGNPAEEFFSWLRLMVVFDVVMGVCGWWLFETVLETN